MGLPLDRDEADRAAIAIRVDTLFTAVAIELEEDLSLQPEINLPREIFDFRPRVKFLNEASENDIATHFFYDRGEMPDGASFNLLQKARWQC